MAQWLDNGEPIHHHGERIVPRSRTFIPAKLIDNPILAATGYEATLQAMPEPLRSILLYGDFRTVMEDDPWQVIPTAWIEAAQARWTPAPPPGARLDAIGRGGSPHLQVREESLPAPALRLSRVARLMALAIRWDDLVQSGAIKDYAALARLGHVSRARISQILNLLYLAPDLQERLLFLERPPRGRDPIHLVRLQPIAALCDWKHQRRRWREQFGTAMTSVEQRPASRPSASRRRVPRSL